MFVHIRKAATALSVLSLILMLGACIPTAPEYTITFVIDDGISGTPSAGLYTYKEFDKVSYKYAATNPNVIWPEIFVNGSRAASEGELTVFNHYTVTVKQIDIRNNATDESDQWQFVLYNKQLGEEARFRLRFVGSSNKSGAFSDTRGYHGIWTINNSKDLVMTYSNWENAVLTGSVSSMEGIWTISSNPDAANWKAVK